MSSNIAVQIKGVKKQFRLPHERHDSIKVKVLDTLKLSNKNRGYTDYKALKGVDLDIKKGEFIGILGRNGAGKSTLLKIIAEIYQPSEGSVKVNGKLVPFIELGVGFNPHLTGRDNVYLNGAMFGFSRKEIDEMYDDIVAFAELEKFMDQKLKNYSSGMQIRLAFSMAIRANADILLLDEVLAVGDAAFKQKCYDYFDMLKDKGKTIILVSHSVGVIRRFCDRAVLIDNGKVAFDGSADETVEKYLDMFRKHEPVQKKEKKKPKEDKLDKRVLIKNVQSTCSFDAINVDVDLASDENLDNIKLALRFLDKSNRVVAGINTQSIINPLAIKIEAGKPKKVKLSMPNILGNGNFSVDIRVGPMVYTGTIHDKVSGVAHFINSKEEVYYPVAMPTKVEIE